MKLFHQLKLDSLLLPIIALLVCLVGWYLIAGHEKTTQVDDGFGDMMTKVERHGISPNLPTPLATWNTSKPYIVEPFAKRGELDQGILRFAWLSLKLVAQGYLIALIVVVTIFTRFNDTNSLLGWSYG